MFYSIQALKARHDKFLFACATLPFQSAIIKVETPTEELLKKPAFRKRVTKFELHENQLSM